MEKTERINTGGFPPIFDRVKIQVEEKKFAAKVPAPISIKDLIGKRKFKVPM